MSELVMIVALFLTAHLLLAAMTRKVRVSLRVHHGSASLDIIPPGDTGGQRLPPA
jgi:hypothetical protein